MEAARTGLVFQNTVGDSALLANRVLAQGAGVCLGDVDGDGMADVFLARTEGANALYRNLGGWRFEDITAPAGVGAPDRYSTGCALADLDGDSDLDLILLSTTGPNAVFVNDGHGRFTERRDLGLDAAGKGGTTVTLADVDGDGALDLYVANYKPYVPADRMPPQAMAFDQVVRRLPSGRYEVRPEHRTDFALALRPDVGGMVMTIRAEPDEFYRNDGTGHLVREPIANNPRFHDARGRPLAAEPESFGLDAKFADLDGDGAPDLYVANDFEDPDQLWLNDGRGGFRLAGWTVQRQMSNSGMGVDVADVNGDGLPDLFEVDMLANDSHRLRTEVPTHTAVPKRPGQMELQLQQQRNTLYLNRGDGTFAEIAAYAGVQASGWSWSTMFLDVDLDGRQDILVANGHLWDLMDGDAQDRIQGGWTTVPWQRHRWEYPRLALPNVAWRNRGDLTFEDVSARWGFGTEPDISHTMAAADLDGDGDLDVVVNRLGSPALLLRNNAAAPRIAVRLKGKAPNTQAVGAKIVVEGGAVPIEEREIVAGGLYMSHSDYLASFATGSAKHVTIEVRWRDGNRTTVRDAAANRLYEIRESGIGNRESAPSNPDSRVPSPGSSIPVPLFEDVTPLLGGHTHTEDAFDDWGRQYLLPDALSQLGPGVTWFDLDRDGFEDLVIGAGKGGRIAVFRNDRGRLAPPQSLGPLSGADLTTMLGLPGEGGARLLAGVSTWEAHSVEEMTAQPAVVAIPLRGAAAGSPEALVGSHESATGPLALGDYDGDGDLDLFIGGRAIAMRYPEAASSGLFRNESGRFVLDTANTGLLRGVGMVSAAMFADIDGDGRPDLLLAREWGSILLLLNDGRGRFTAAPASWGLDRWTSRWNGLAAGDLNGDGRLDLVATSWGRNTGLAAPALVRQAGTYAGYADATVDRLLGSAAGGAGRLVIATLDHLVLLNRGTRFDAAPLPAEAQFAPAFYAGIADFDGDGNEDLFLGQNFSATALGVPRYDGGRGLLLLGDGQGALRPMPGQRSGLIVYGDQRGAAYADFDGDGRLDLAVSQNGAATRLFRNNGAKPGLRVRLAGPATNPDGVGAQIRIDYGDHMGPVREIQAGSGYWSENGAVQVLGLTGKPAAVWVRWPGGVERKVPVPEGAREVVVRR
jgi:hypothetical protein